MVPNADELFLLKNQLTVIILTRKDFFFFYMLPSMIKSLSTYSALYWKSECG